VSRGPALLKPVPAGAAPRSFPFLVGVSLHDSAMKEFAFDQDRVLIGRAEDADLQIVHQAIGRHQLTIERIIPPIGQPRFRIVPHPATNPVIMSGVPAVEGALRIGEPIAIGETRLVLLRPRPAGTGLTPARLAIVGLAAVATVVCAVALFGGPPASAPDALVVDKLFTRLPNVVCLDSRQCIERARVAYEHGKTYAKQGSSVAGNWYRAAMEFYRADQFERLSRTRIAGLEDARGRLEQAADAAEAIFNDLQFRLTRELKVNDPRALRKTIDALQAMVPDEEHPIRVRLAEYLRTHPLPPLEPGK
jgi:hypothetical protein